MTIRRQFYFRIFAGILIGMVPLGLMAEEEETHEKTFPTSFIPWFTGPLIAPSGFTIQKGHVSVQPYLYFTVFNALYDKRWKAQGLPNFYSTQLQAQTRFGIAKNFDFRVTPQFFYNRTEGRGYGNIGDLPFSVSVQLLRPKIDSPWPGIRLNARASAPIGKYQHLKPSLKFTDAIGSGSWDPGLTLAISKLLQLAPVHYLSTRLIFNYDFGLPVRVRGVNSYGGAPDTRGTVHLGNTCSVNAALEYNLTRQFAVACDLIYFHSNRIRFTGKVGTAPSGEPAVNNLPSSDEFSVAPAFEYNWSRNIGIIGGVFYNFAGRNTPKFTSGVLAINIYI